MESAKRLGIAVFTILVTVCADPNCQIFEEKDMVCVAGIDDYVLRKGLVSDIPQATKVTLRNCRVIDIDIAAFDNDHSLQYIDLAENKIASLKPGVLDGNFQVTHLNLSYNRLTTIPSGLFDQKVNLEVLDLRGNRLNSLPADAFIPLRKLVHLDLSSNDFLGKDMSMYLFNKNRKIKFMDFSRNDMSYSPENLLNAFQELDFLHLERCSLKDIPLFATKANLKTMTHLSLATNQISRIDQARIFMSLEKLEYLNIAENLIEIVVANVFIHLKEIKVIILRNNRLKTLPDGFFRNLFKLENVDLSHNMLDYVPLSAFRGTAIQTLDFSNNRFSYLDAYFCVQLRNAGLRITKFYFNDNPWQCACLNDIMNEMKTYGIEYNTVKYDGKHAVCVTTKIFTCKRHSNDNELFVEMFDSSIKGIPKQ